MATTKFKVGDRVRRIDHDSSWAPIGFETVVVDDNHFVDANGETERIVIDGRWELIPPTAEAVSGAIRTVTRREIVPGVYGGVRIVGQCNGGIDFGLVGRAGRSDSWVFDTFELREAAHLFNQIAEVLEENAALEMKEAA